MCAKLVHNYTANGSSTTDEYGTQLILNRILSGEVVEGFTVVANGTPNMTVLVQPGSARIPTGTYPASYGYLVSHDTSAGESVTITTAAASPRIDYIVGYVDKSVAASTSPTYVNNTNNVLKFAAVAGTPAASPSVPTLSQIQTAIGASNPYVILAQVAVGASVSTITNANITDKRTMAAMSVAAPTTIQTVATVVSSVATGTTVMPADDTIPQITEGDQYMSLSITPRLATNRLFIEVKAQVSHSGAIVDIVGGLFQDSTANALAAGFVTQPGTTYKNILVIGCDMLAGTTSSTTFKFRAGGGGAGTVTLNGNSGTRLLGGVMSSYIKITEYRP